MKKIFTLIVTITLLCLSLCACSEDATDTMSQISSDAMSVESAVVSDGDGFIGNEQGADGNDTANATTSEDSSSSSDTNETTSGSVL